MSNKPITDRWPALIDLFPSFIDWPTANFDKYANFDWQEVYDVLKAIETALGYITAKVGLERVANQSIPNATWTSVSFDNEIVDIGDYHAVGNPTRITISAATARDHLVTFHVHFPSADPAKEYVARIFKNGSDIVVGPVERFFDVLADSHLSYFFLIPQLSDGDYIELQVWQNTGGAKDLLGGAGKTSFSAKILPG